MMPLENDNKDEELQKMPLQSQYYDTGAPNSNYPDHTVRGSGGERWGAVVSGGERWEEIEGHGEGGWRGDAGEYRCAQRGWRGQSERDSRESFLEVVSRGHGTVRRSLPSLATTRRSLPGETDDRLWPRSQPRRASRMAGVRGVGRDVGGEGDVEWGETWAGRETWTQFARRAEMGAACFG
ncbi:unnamed protein product [Lampetra planeri]